jgi:hypothetical protein
MRQFDVCPNPSARSKGYAPFVVVLQSHLLEAMPTTIVAPLLHAEGRTGYKNVSASVMFNGELFIVSVAEIAVVEAKRLEVVGHIGDYEYEIRRAIDGVFTGF